MMDRYTAIVLDDEERGRNALVRFLTDFCPEIEIVGISSSGEQAFEQIIQLRPQVLFLDIEIAQPGSEYRTTFQLLQNIPNYNFEVVFVTAYENYAIQAIRAHAVGYVLKPISIQDLVECVKGVSERLETSNTSQRLTDLVQHIQSDQPSSNRIWIHSLKDVIPVNFKDIIRLEAQGKYTDIHCGNRKLTSSKNLGEFSEILNPNQFVKVHRSHIVSLEKIEKYAKHDGGTVLMEDGKEIPVSKSGKERLFQLL